eukprot:12755780-Alexandrium_andersonii.AAC.1
MAGGPFSLLPSGPSVKPVAASRSRAPLRWGLSLPRTPPTGTSGASGLTGVTAAPRTPPKKHLRRA